MSPCSILVNWIEFNLKIYTATLTVFFIIIMNINFSITLRFFIVHCILYTAGKQEFKIH